MTTIRNHKTETVLLAITVLASLLTVSGQIVFAGNDHDTKVCNNNYGNGGGCGGGGSGGGGSGGGGSGGGGSGGGGSGGGGSGGGGSGGGGSGGGGGGSGGNTGSSVLVDGSNTGINLQTDTNKSKTVKLLARPQQSQTHVQQAPLIQLLRTAEFSTSDNRKTPEIFLLFHLGKMCSRV
jgi:hypothetical protein